MFDYSIENMKRILPWLVVCLLCVAGCDHMRDFPEDDKTEITVLFAYTSAVRQASGNIDALIERAVAETNKAYDNSEILIRLRRVHSVEVDYHLTERFQDLTRFARNGDGYMDEVHALRDEYEADICVLIAERREATINAAIMAEPKTAFAVVYYAHLGAPNYALAHEIGHLQGARHSVESGVFEEPFPYGHALRTPQWRTIMSTGSEPVIPHFANPDVFFGGIPTGSASRANVARVLNETAAYISNFRGPRTPTDFVPPALFPVVEVD
jgi:peptidyl-Asp metalloendopeptidase